MKAARAPRTIIATVLAVAVIVVLGVLVWNDRQREGQDDQASAAPTGTSLADGEIHGPWTVRYTGYGEVTGYDEEIVLEPRPAESRDVTHGALVHTTQQCQDADFALTMRTEAQVRQGDPNPWEVGWVLWNFRSDVQFYAVALKPNGWEISKQDPDYPGNQRFIASGTEPQFPIGAEYRVAVTQDWPQMTVTVDGAELATVTDEESPHRGGAIGLYTEDARVRFSDFDLPDCPGP